MHIPWLLGTLWLVLWLTVVWPLDPGSMQVELGVIAAFELVTVLIPWLVVLGRRRKPQRDIVVDATTITLPRSADSRKVDVIPLQALRALDEPRRGRLVIVGPRRIYVYPREVLGHDGCARLRAAVWRRLRMLPGGAEKVRRFEHTARHALDAELRWPVMTLWLAVINVLVFYAVPAPEGEAFAHVTIGANARTLVLAGEWWRLPVAGFLHVNQAHLFANIVLMILVGRSLEKMRDRGELIAIFALTNIVASLGSTLNSAVYTLGSSGCVYGLVGALAYLVFRDHPDIPVRHGVLARRWLVLFAVVSVVDLFLQGPDGLRVDHFAHGAGFLAGVGSAALFSRAEMGLAHATASILVGLTAAAGLLAFQHPRAHQQDLRRVADDAAEKFPHNAYVLNSAAWVAATDPGADQEFLERAETWVRQARILDVETDGIKDTHATVLFRLGRLEEALEVEEGLLQRVGVLDRFFLTQLARFSSRRLQRHGPVIGASLGALPRATVTVGPTGQAVVVVETGPGMPRRYSLVAVHGEGLSHILYHCTQQAAAEEEVLVPDAMASRFSDGDELRVIMFRVLDETHPGCGRGSLLVEGDPAALKLP
ncbi:MAG: rhomboid family intramembrane serine protease [Myxococcota bacterium]